MDKGNISKLYAERRRQGGQAGASDHPERSDVLTE